MPRLNSRICISIPTLSTARRSVQWMDSMAGIGMPLGSSAARQWVEDQPIADARNSLCQKALEVGAQYIFFLGDDVIVPSNTLLMLLDKIGRTFPTRTGEARASMITGIYWTKVYPPEPYIFRLGSPSGNLLDGSYRDWRAGEFFDVDVAGCDCLLLETAMLKEIPQPWFSTDWVWEEGQTPSSIATEDYYFYTKARQHGFHLFADTAIQCLHEDRTTGAAFGLSMDMPQAGGIPEVGEEEVLIADLGAGLFTHPTLFGPKAKIIRFDGRESVKPDFRCDIRHMEERWMGKFDWVNSSHVLEHLRRAEAVSAVQHWIKLLKPGGKITIHVPNIERAMKLILDPPPESQPAERSYWWSQLYGDQAEEGTAWQHRNGFTRRKLDGLMKQIPELVDITVEEEDGGQNLKATGTLSKKPQYFNVQKAWEEIDAVETPSVPTNGVVKEAVDV